jgi:hypothetical protein
MTRSLLSWLRGGSVRKPARRPARRRHLVPHLDVLEDRTLLNTYTVTNLADSGPGSLRQAVLDADAHNGTDQIRFAAGLHGTVAVTGGPLSVTDHHLAITGPGPDTIALSGGHSSRLFEIAGGSDVTISRLAFTQGRASAGGAVLEEAGAALTLRHCAFSGNQAVGDAHGNALGGAVFTSAGASLRVDSCTFQGNETDGANQSFGGALYNLGTATVTGSRFAANQAREAPRALTSRWGPATWAAPSWTKTARRWWSATARLPATRRWAPLAAMPKAVRSTMNPPSCRLPGWA